MWKIASNALPLKGMHANMNDETVAMWAPCPLCLEGPETPLHLFTLCPVAIVLWRHSVKPIDITCIIISSTKALVKYFIVDAENFFTQPQDHRATVIDAAITLDVIWKARNGVVHSQEPVLLPNLIKDIHACVQDHLLAWDHVDKHSRAVWQAPEPGWLKINTDVAVRSYGSFTAVSCRDALSSLCYVSTERIDAVDPLLGEAYAVLTAMKQASLKRWSKVYFECDSLILCNEVQSKSMCSIWHISEYVKQIQALLSQYRFWQLKWIPSTAGAFFGKMGS